MGLPYVLYRKVWVIFGIRMGFPYHFWGNPIASPDQVLPACNASPPSSPRRLWSPWRPAGRGKRVGDLKRGKSQLAVKSPRRMGDFTWYFTWFFTWFHVISHDPTCFHMIWSNLVRTSWNSRWRFKRDLPRYMWISPVTPRDCVGQRKYGKLT